MQTVTPYIPRQITVHLGAPESYAANVTVPFNEYVKNVASSEVYPTWDESALRANILAISSFALNRVYTEFYRSRGYRFDITSSTAIDQKFINGRNIFDNISKLVDGLYTSYIRKRGSIEPLAAKYCNGTTVTCSGMSQWGSQNLARQGKTAGEILRYYYGSDVELVNQAPVRGYTPSYPGTPLRRGSQGAGVVQAQVMLDRVARNYPSIPRVDPIDGIFGSGTEASVRRFQQIFNLTSDGIVGRTTWYQLVRLYVGILELAELDGEGQMFLGSNWQAPPGLQVGSTGVKVQQLQYMLRVMAEYVSTIETVEMDGIFGPKTEEAVIAFQRFAGLTPDGIVGPATWAALYSRVVGVVDSSNSLSSLSAQYPGRAVQLGDSDFS
ncbi:MAG: peptidoglycan-binding protein [Candidatus Faecousia sp.]|uniref:peptidoglycan-binding domain-containing protein n=1 Tax=Faecousia sp. TaxID=2952921 RepID=UPI002A880D79|nr:peptidoglycan-binding protein [Candidatus Faecousia sp.]